MRIPILQVDAFTSRPFQGNPAAVCLLPGSAEEHWMQAVAQEMNLSETAFLWPHEEGFRLRWFTPTVEVDLCGHATLASAHVLWETGMLEKTLAAIFHTRSGTLTARLEGDWIEMDFPSDPPQPAPAPAELGQALGAEILYTGRGKFDILAEVASEEILRQIKPDFGLLAAIPARGIIVTSQSNSDQFDFVSRFFAPQSGINEDPVTGSSHCCSGPFWAERLQKAEMLAFQASSRGGVIRVRPGSERVYLGGQAVTVLRGELIAMY